MIKTCMHVGVFSLVSAVALAADPAVRGSVQILGSEANARVHVLEASGKVAHKLCKGAIADSLAKVTGMQISVSGTVKFPGTRSKKCLEVKGVTFEKSNSGNPVLVGLLKKDDQKIYLYEDSGKKRQITNRPSGIDTLLDKKVILVLPKEKTYPEDLSSILVESILENPMVGGG